MRILHVAPSIERSYGGPTQSLAGYVAASRVGGADVQVAAPRASAAEVEALETVGAARVLTFRSFGAGGSASSPALVRWVGRNCHAFDVVHVHGLFNFISTFSARVAVARGAPVVIRPFGTLSRYTFGHRRGTLKRGWFRLLERRNILRAAALHFTTVSERDEAEWHGLPVGDKAHVVPPPFLRSPERPERIAGDPDRPEVLFLGRMHPVKNLEALIDAWPIVRQSVPRATLVIAGGGQPEYAEHVRRRAGERGIGHSVSFSGFLSGRAKAEVFARASVFVLPSLHENFGMAVLEAIAAGLPVVVSKEVQLRDFVVEHQLGIVTDGSPAAIAAAIVRVLRDDKLQARVAADGWRLVTSAYSPEAVGTGLSTMYLAAVQYHHTRQRLVPG